jgi:hypothetical protein
MPLAGICDNRIMPDTAPHVVLADLQEVFTTRLEAFVSYAPARSPRPSVAIVTTLTFDDLSACAARSKRWRRAGLATPVLLTRAEFGRSLDAFPVEFGEIIANHETLFGQDPFDGLAVAALDLRRACETQVRSLLLHLREDFVEAAANRAAVRALVTESAPEFRALLLLIARLEDRHLGDVDLADWAADRLGLDRTTVHRICQVASNPTHHAVDTERLFSAYLAAVERLARRIDEWT